MLGAGTYYPLIISSAEYPEILIWLPVDQEWMRRTIPRAPAISTVRWYSVYRAADCRLQSFVSAPLLTIELVSWLRCSPAGIAITPVAIPMVVFHGMWACLFLRCSLFTS